MRLSPSSFFASLVALVLPVSALAMGIQVMIDGKAVVLSDVPQSAWFASYVRDGAEAGIVSGYRDSHNNPTGKYGPSNNITIAEALKIMSEGAGYDEQAYASKVPSGVMHWSSPYVSVAKAEAFAVIDPRVKLDRPATRAEVSALLASAFRVDITHARIDGVYTDVSGQTQYAASIGALSQDKVVSGDTDINGQATGHFRPTDRINRAEVAKMVMQARMAYKTPGQGRMPVEQQGNTQTENVVTYTNAGFSPSVLRIHQGDIVTFKNQSTGSLWVASNPHPTHTDLPGFDAGGGITQGSVYVFTFARIGTWGYHNHLNPSQGGSIVVK